MQEIKPLCDKLITQSDLKLPADLASDIDLKISTDLECGLKIFSTSRIPISKIIPIMNDFGFVVISEVTFELEDRFVTKLSMDPKDRELLDRHFENIKIVLINALENRIKSGHLFELVYRENFCLRGILLFRSFVSYIKNTVSEFNERDLVNTLVKHHTVSGEFLDYFLIKFEPLISDREAKLERSIHRIKESFKSVEQINEDRILKYMFELLQSIVRSNFFNHKGIIAHKIDLSKLKKHLRGIQPNIEAYIYSPTLIGTHQRVSKVSRGGIRWSSRRDDFRSEIKSLMATQEAKNAIIVPKGAKGGFVILKDNITKEEFERYYRLYINSLLDLIDNQKEGQIYHRDDMVCYDGFDSYFVVAADRGTSSMSGVANEIAKERGFWLGDAFASGSNTGYHHKKLGITAKGALRSAQRFFIEKGVDFYKESISVVGVGSMSGDVFGNGMLESQMFKLIAAISHDEIFVDPNPNLKLAYEERRRLFLDPRGKWSHYDETLISKGGGIYKRSEKSIILTDEIRELLNTQIIEMSGEELAREILKLEVDMLYFGGIGTYVKSSDEDNISIGDKENEYVRVDASKLRAFCICEGANLALTMRARIEYALNGGKINLDSIDNAAGVNTSDHEVNFKILLNDALSNKKIDNNQRIQLLHNASDFVVKSVLHANYLQSLAISLDQIRSNQNVKNFKKVVRILESKMDIFKRSLFSIPKERDFGEIIDDDGNIVRPVLATLMLYSKIFLQDLLLESDMIKDSFFEKYLFEYFPQEFVEKFSYEIKAHSLGYEIISMVVANKIINQKGVTFITDYDRLGNELFLKKIKEYLASDLEHEKIYQEIYDTDYKIDVNEQYMKLLEI